MTRRHTCLQVSQTLAHERKSIRANTSERNVNETDYASLNSSGRIIGWNDLCRYGFKLARLSRCQNLECAARILASQAESDMAMMAGVLLVIQLPLKVAPDRVRNFLLFMITAVSTCSGV